MSCYNKFMNYFIEKLLKDKIVIDSYKKIDETNTFPANHGMKHILNTLKIAKNFERLLNLSEREIDILETCLVLHDIGQVRGRFEHEYKSMRLAKEILVNYNYFDVTELGIIYLAIKNHDITHDHSKLGNKMEWLVNLIDKLDFSKYRLEENYREKFDYSVYEEVERLEIFLTDNIFKIKITKIDNPSLISIKELLSRNLFSKAMFTFKNFCEKFGYIPKVYLENEEIDLEFIDLKVMVER